MKIAVSVERIKALIIVIIMHLVIYISIFDIKILKYLDEVTTLLLILYLIFFCKKKITNYNLGILICLLLFVSVGIISGVFSGIDIERKAAMIDMFSFFKWPVAFVYADTNLSDKMKYYIVRIMSQIGKVILFITFLCGIVNLITDIGMSYDYRYGMRSFMFIFKNPGTMNMVNLIYYCCISRISPKKGKCYFIILVICTLLSLRAMGFGVLICYVIIGWVLKNRRKIKFRYMLLPIIPALIVSWNQIRQYIFSASVRSIMLRSGVYFAMERFPLGYGFASFGSDQAFQVNSVLYERLGFNMKYFEPYRNDNFWPMILGQCGVLGLILYVALLTIALLYIVKRKNENNVLLIMCILFLNMIIGSIGGAIYTNAYSMVMFAIIVSLNYVENKEAL